MNQFSALPLMPLDPSWIEQHPAFFHDDPRLAKAALQLLFAAWRGVPAATIPASHAYIAQACALPRELVTEHYVVLTHGFVLGDDGVLHHSHLAHVVDELGKRYGKEIEQYSMSMVMAAQDPEEFAVGSVEGKSTKRPRGKTKLPRDFGWQLMPGMEDHLATIGYAAANQRAWLMNDFMDYCSSRGILSQDWTAEFRRYAANQIASFAWKIPAAEMPQDMFDAGEGATTPGGGGFARFGRRGAQVGRSASRGDEATNHNLNVFAAAGARRTA